MNKSIAEQLDSLLELQAIDSELDAIVKVRGDLPTDIANMQNKLAEFHINLQKGEESIKAINKSVLEYRASIKEKKASVDKYEKQQANVRNNREYDAITKEIELQNLDIQIAEKRIKEAHVETARKKLEVSDLQLSIEEFKKVLKDKEEELEKLVSETEMEEQEYCKKREVVAKHIGKPILDAYERVKLHVKNKIAAVKVKKGACGGCFITIPPQTQIQLAKKEEVISCEYCARIIADVELDISEDTDFQPIVQHNLESGLNFE